MYVPYFFQSERLTLFVRKIPDIIFKIIKRKQNRDSIKNNVNIVYEN